MIDARLVSIYLVMATPAQDGDVLVDEWFKIHTRFMASAMNNDVPVKMADVIVAFPKRYKTQPNHDGRLKTAGSANRYLSDNYKTSGSMVVTLFWAYVDFVKRKCPDPCHCSIVIIDFSQPAPYPLYYFDPLASARQKAHLPLIVRNFIKERNISLTDPKLLYGQQRDDELTCFDQVCDFISSLCEIGKDVLI